MTESALAVTGYVAWMLVLILIMECMRTYLVLAKKKSPETFLPDGSDVSPFAHRLARAHANCYESFPITCGPLLIAMATGLSAITAPLALWLLGARVVQSAIHLISTAPSATTVRFLFFLIQLIISLWWIFQLAGHFLS